MSKAGEAGLNKVKTKISSNETTNSVVWTQQMNHSDLNKSTVLPTFSCKIGNAAVVRCMLDTGCQTNFILERLATQNDFPVVKRNVQLTVNGFNSSKEYNTNIVSIPITVGKKLFNIEAVSVPNIDINLYLPNLGKVVSSLKNLDYVLADSFLSSNENSINNLGFILGSESAHCLPVSTVVFGKQKPFALLLTLVGIMLQGGLEPFCIIDQN